MEHSVALVRRLAKNCCLFLRKFTRRSERQDSLARDHERQTLSPFGKVPFGFSSFRRQLPATSIGPHGLRTAISQVKTIALLETIALDRKPMLRRKLLPRNQRNCCNQGDRERGADDGMIELVGEHSVSLSIQEDQESLPLTV